MNSFKMKFSILIGVIQMGLGIYLKSKNLRFWKDSVKLYCVYYPQLLFLVCSMGYLSILIIVKWLTDYKGGGAPSIIGVMVNFLVVSDYLIFSQSFQQVLQITLFVILLICVPWMLFLGPVLNFVQSKQKEVVYNSSLVITQDPLAAQMQQSHPNSEIFIEYLIESIEFLLGTISNTASYLRLWALSLAHSQLSRVFFNMIFWPSI